MKDNIIVVIVLSNLSATFSNLRSIAYNLTVAAVSRTDVGETSMFMITLTITKARLQKVSELLACVRTYL